MSGFLSEYGALMGQGVIDSLLMVFISTLFAYIIGLPLGILVRIPQPGSIMPFTRMIVGSATGVRGAIVPLIVAAAPFVARLIETSLMEVDEGLIEVAHATGSTIPQIVFKVMLPESKPSILMGIPITLITLIGYSAMAGAVGAGGLGDIALRYGYYRYQDAVMLATVVLIVILVQIIQSVGTIIAKKTDRRIRK